MQRLTIRLDPETYAQLQQEARRRNVAPARLARELIEKALSEKQRLDPTVAKLLLRLQGQLLPVAANNPGLAECVREIQRLL